MNYVERLVSIESKPYLFSYRRCPYAMRARMALVESNIKFDIYEISLKNKPDEMLSISSKGTVPILRFKDKNVSFLNEIVLEESLEIMQWAYQNNRKPKLLGVEKEVVDDQLIELNDGKFKVSLDCYKYFERYPDKSKVEHRESCYFFLEILEKRLVSTTFLIGDKRTFTDIAIFPFIRQFMNVDKEWFENSEYKRVWKWLLLLIESDLFKKVMIKPKLS